MNPWWFYFDCRTGRPEPLPGFGRLAAVRRRSRRNETLWTVSGGAGNACARNTFTVRGAKSNSHPPLRSPALPVHSANRNLFRRAVYIVHVYHLFGRLQSGRRIFLGKTSNLPLCPPVYSSMTREPLYVPRLPFFCRRRRRTLATTNKQKTKILYGTAKLLPCRLVFPNQKPRKIGRIVFFAVCFRYTWSRASQVSEELRT